MISISFSICCFIFLSIIACTYFSKEKLNNIENKTFSIIIIVNLIGIIIDVGGFASFNLLGSSNIINIIIAKIYLIYFVTYAFCLMMYIYNISYKEHKHKRVFYYLFIVISSFLFILPINIHFDGIIGYTYGLAVNFGYGTGSLIIFIMFILSIKAKKEIGKKCIPLFSFVILLLIVVIIQKINPQLVLLLLCNSIVTTLMFFTIENPDMKMLKELEKSNELLETEMEEKSNLMFKISQDVRIPLNSIEELSSNMINEKSIKTLVNDSKIINSEAKGISFIVNNLLDISNMNINNIKLYKTKVNINTLLKEISLMFNDKDFKYSTLNNIPDIYLDNVRIKQILVSLINYSFNNKSNNCYLEISGILRYDMCRLLITINTNNKLDIKYINEIMNSKDIEDIDTNSLDLDLISIKSLISMLNGSFNIKSNDSTTYSIIIDTELVNKENKYNLKNKKVLLIDDDKDELNKYRDILKSLDISVNTSMFLSDIENRIDTINDYDLILIDDEMQPYNAVKIMEYKEKYNIDSKIVIMLGINKEFIKDKYIKDYKFDDYILKRDYSKEINKIVDKYL